MKTLSDKIETYRETPQEREERLDRTYLAYIYGTPDQLREVIKKYENIK